MSRHTFDPACPDCRPVLCDPATMRPLPSEHPAMQAMNAVWDASPREDQEAFHRVTVLNGRDPADLARCQALNDRFQKALAS